MVCYIVGLISRVGVIAEMYTGEGVLWFLHKDKLLIVQKGRRKGRKEGRKEERKEGRK